MKSTDLVTSGDFSSLIGIPYEEKNCFDLTREFYRLVLGIELKHYFDGKDPGRDQTKALIYTNIGDFIKVEVPEFGDIVLIKLYGVESHIAVYVGGDKILHTLKGAGSLLDRLGRWDKNIVGFYRVRGDSQ